MNKSSEIRRRKGASDKGGKNEKRPMRKSKDAAKNLSSSSLLKSLICVCICGLLLILVSVIYIDNDIPLLVTHRIVDSMAKKLGSHYPVHAVIIDAGSTGSRVTAFTFHKAILDGHLVLDQELFEYTKPGISSFADDPLKAVESIDGLIEQAKGEIPEQYWKHTPLVFRATAGLRLLPQAKANALLDAIRTYLKRVPFKTDENAVKIMDGTDEGIFSWFTVNYLLLTIGNPTKTVAALDLGGGSTQVTFLPQTPATLRQKEFIHEALLPRGKTNVFTNSYLGLGLKEARKEILTYGLKSDQTQLTSDCLNKVVFNQTWHYGGVDYTVSGPQTDFPFRMERGTAIRVGGQIPIVNIAKCTAIAKKYVQSKVKPLHELSNQRIFAFSYYFDKAAQLGLIDELKGGSVTIRKLFTGVENACNDANTDQPFICLDMIFITTLFTDGFGLDNSTVINMYKKISGHEVSWALGCAYDVLQQP